MQIAQFLEYSLTLTLIEFALHIHVLQIMVKHTINVSHLEYDKYFAYFWVVISMFYCRGMEED